MYKLKVEKMHCKSCFLNIQDALYEVDQNAKAEADFKQRILSVKTSASLQEVLEAVKDAGYPGNAIKED